MGQLSFDPGFPRVFHIVSYEHKYGFSIVKVSIHHRHLY